MNIVRNLEDMESSSSEGSADPRPEFVSLKRLIHYGASEIHMELQNMLSGLEPMSNTDRKHVLIDYIQRTRHMILRLLALLRWSSKYGKLTMKADVASRLASAREDSFEVASDELWSCAHRLKSDQQLYKAVGIAADVLVNGRPHFAPTSVGNIVEIPLEPVKLTKDQILNRLQALTHGFVKSSFPHGVVGMEVMRKPSKNGVRGLVCVGCPNIWEAEIILDNIRVEEAFLRVKSLQIFVDIENEDSFTESKGLVSTDRQLLVLRRLCDDRMKISVQSMDKKDRRNPVARIRCMLLDLQNLLVEELCVPLMIDCLTKDARALSDLQGYEVQVLGTDSKDSSLVVQYWDRSYCTGQIIIQSYMQTNANGRNKDTRRNKPLVTVKHSPEVATTLKLGLYSFVPNRLSFETLLRQTLFARLHERMKQLRSVIVANQVAKLEPSNVRVTVNLERLSTSLVVILREPSSGLELRCSKKSGALRVRPFGVALIALRNCSHESVGLWHGEKQFESFPEEVSAVINAIFIVSRKMQLEAAATAMCVLDVGATRTLPPGTAWVAASSPTEPPTSQLVPPFAPLERRAPRRFLTLSEPPPRENSGSFSSPMDVGSKPKQRLTYASTSDGLVFIQEGAFPEAENRYSGSAAAAASWAVAREAVERRLRRDSLLRAFSAASVASPASIWSPHGQYDESDLDMDTASRTLLRVKCEPLPVQRAELLLRGNYAWQIRLSLLPAIFDTDTREGDGDCPPRETSWSVGLSCVDSTLTFTYPSTNAPSVRSFFRDLTRARTAAALARGVPSSPLYTVVRRSPVRLIVAINPGGGANNAARNSNPCTVTVEYVYSRGNSGGFSVTFSPSKPTFVQLAPLVEETLDASGGSVGTVLAGLLERACPVAAAAEASVRERGKGRIRFVTALRVRAIFKGLPRPPRNSRGAIVPNAHLDDQATHAVDVDARNGGGIAKVIDVGRATAVMTAQSFANSGGSNNRHNRFAPVPMWDEIVEQLGRNDVAVSICANSTVFIKMEHLEEFLARLVQSARGETAA